MTTHDPIPARLAALNVLAHIRHETNDWQQLDSVLRIDGHISSAENFHNQPKVLDGASDLFKQVLQTQAGPQISGARWTGETRCFFSRSQQISHGPMRC